MVTRLTILLCIAIFAQGCSSRTPITSSVVNIGGETFTLELVLDQSSRANGLMNRTSIAKDGGMLFVFTESSNRSFWMKSCLVDIDLIFLDSRGTVTALHEMTVEPPQEAQESTWDYEGRLTNYWSRGPSRFAIELAAGSIKRLKLRINDIIKLDLNQLKSMAR
ncbi:MAG: DUF192 domain-containing protein [Phycisphaerales bacterium]|nr:DUF192 domain-containing protein [Planctomycetota bacterium]MBL6997743.1 DUF192 domain-containing protein [Phycisphaerales bacterium]